MKPAVSWADWPGPLHATLRFGVGARDETYRTLGLSRLVAALAAYTARRRLAERAEPVVSTGLEETQFALSPEEVSNWLEALCMALSDLPADRIGEVAHTLDADGARSLDSRAAGALNARYGSQRHDVVGGIAPGRERTAPSSSAS
ncbi:hypothetical protein [Streptomyces sp. NPDC058142]|uniref:hypothetical protein n=1 Tax=Streptomyces sp. NPDC058142 TaxID=3346355 RepID=UPI0036F1322E